MSFPSTSTRHERLPPPGEPGRDACGGRSARTFSQQYLAADLLTMNFPQLYRDRLIEAFDSIDLGKVSQAIELLAEAREQGRRIFVCGNGGSASTASHFATDLVKGASYGRNS